MDRLVDIWEVREPPPEVLRQLREVDPRAELVYMGEGRWWYGMVVNNSDLRRRGHRLAWKILDNWGDGLYNTDESITLRYQQLRQALLMRQGFDYGGEVVFQGEPSGGYVAEQFILARTGQLARWKHQREEQEKLARRRERDAEEAEAYNWFVKRHHLGREDKFVAMSTSNAPAGKMI